MSKKIVLYSTSATGFGATKKYITYFQNLLQAKKVQFEEVDCALEENKERREEMVKASNGIRILPQLHIDGKYIGQWNEVEDLNDAEQLDFILGV